MLGVRISILATLFVAASSGTAMASAYTFATITIPGATTTVAEGINDLGQVVGTYSNPTTNQRAFIENVSSGAVTTYSYPPQFGTYANGINNQGQIVGYNQMSGGGIGYVRDPVSGAFTMLPQEGGFPNGYSAYGINDAGQVVGNFQVGYHSGAADQSFLYDPVTGTSSTFVDPATGTTSGFLGATPVGYTHAYDINNRGQIVGATIVQLSPTATTTTPTGFLLNLATNTYTTLYVPGSTSTIAYGINDNGQVVGNYQIGSTTNGFLLDLSTGQFTTLSDPSGTSTTAYGINNAGQIVGTFLDSNRNTDGFIATPTAIASMPEPASLTVLGGSICALTWARRRTKSRPRSGASCRKKAHYAALMRPTKGRRRLKRSPCRRERSLASPSRMIERTRASPWRRTR